jgi:hypothetical protein
MGKRIKRRNTRHDPAMGHFVLWSRYDAQISLALPAYLRVMISIALHPTATGQVRTQQIFLSLRPELRIYMK